MHRLTDWSGRSLTCVQGLYAIKGQEINCACSLGLNMHFCASTITHHYIKEYKQENNVESCWQHNTQNRVPADP